MNAEYIPTQEDWEDFMNWCYLQENMEQLQQELMEFEKERVKL